MGRNRKSEDKLPKYVYKGRSKYEYRPYSKGKKRITIILCSLDSPFSKVWEEWEKHQEKKKYTLAWLLNSYIESQQFLSSADSTIKEHKRQVLFLKKYKTKNGLFGDQFLSSFSKGVIRKYLDKRETDNAPVSGNREVALISKAWNWMLERDLIIYSNPCFNVTKNTESPERRYVTDNEYYAAYNLATSYLKPAMELAYLCRMRRLEVLSAKKNDIQEEGFETRRLKGSRDAITEWSDRLRSAIELAGSSERIMDGIWLIQNRYGQQISTPAFKSAWTRLKIKMKKEGIAPFNFHDLKAKGVSDFEGNKKDASGHKTEAMVAVYDRKKPTVKATK